MMFNCDGMNVGVAGKCYETSVNVLQKCDAMNCSAEWRSAAHTQEKVVWHSVNATQ